MIARKWVKKHDRRPVSSRFISNVGIVAAEILHEDD